MFIRTILSRPATALTGAVFAHYTLRGFAYANLELIQRGLIPPLYSSGVRYAREPEGVETFADAAYALKCGYADCSILAAWRVAELWAAGETKADIYIRWNGYSNGHRLYHVMVRRGDRSIEDPSRLLGM